MDKYDNFTNDIHNAKKNIISIINENMNNLKEKYPEFNFKLEFDELIVHSFGGKGNVEYNVNIIID